MAKEIERKYLIDIQHWNYQGRPVEMKQAYLAIDNDKVIRVRVADDKAFITIKANTKGITRDEYEYAIPVADANEMMKLALGNVVSKTRYMYEFGNKTWEIDVFDQENTGLVVAEIELISEDEEFKKPSWLMEEVSTDVKYYNFNLSQKPYSQW